MYVGLYFNMNIQIYKNTIIEKNIFEICILSFKNKINRSQIKNIFDQSTKYIYIYIYTSIVFTLSGALNGDFLHFLYV